MAFFQEIYDSNWIKVDCACVHISLITTEEALRRNYGDQSRVKKNKNKLFYSDMV